MSSLLHCVCATCASDPITEGHEALTRLPRFAAAFRRAHEGHRVSVGEVG